jgi:hypothetical protein
MRYMMLIYTKETENGPSPEEARQIRAAHWEVMSAATRKGILLGAEPLSPTATATTVRAQNGQRLITDGPFAETKEQLAGYYILDCENLDEAIEWAARIPTACKGNDGCIEIRPLPGLPARPANAAGTTSETGQPVTRNG